MNTFEKSCLAVIAACAIVAINAMVWGLCFGF